MESAGDDLIFSGPLVGSPTGSSSVRVEERVCRSHPVEPDCPLPWVDQGGWEVRRRGWVKCDEPEVEGGVLLE